MTFVRTVLGDIDPGRLGVTYAHEHFIIEGGAAGGHVARLPPRRCRADGRGAASRRRGRPAVRGRRDAGRLRPQRRASWPSCRGGRGVHVIAATGLHHEKFYGAVALEPARVDRRGDREPVRRGRRGRDRRARLRRPDRPPDRGPGRDHQDRRQRGRPVRARPADLPGRRRSRTRGPACRSTPTARRAPARSSRSALLVDAGVPAGAHLAEPRRQDRRPRLPPRAARDRGVRRLRPGVPLGRPAQRHAPAPRVGASRTATPDR